jgi:hypothetical protein
MCGAETSEGDSSSAQHVKRGHTEIAMALIEGGVRSRRTSKGRHSSAQA